MNREKLQKSIRDGLADIEDRIYDLEGIYLSETGTFGNIVKGWDSLISFKNHRHNSLNTNRKNKVQEKDRLFSLSSMSSEVNGRLRRTVDQADPEISNNNIASTRLKKKLKKSKNLMNTQKGGYVRSRDMEDDNESEVAKSPHRKRSMMSKNNKKSGATKNGTKKTRASKQKRNKKKKD